MTTMMMMMMMMMMMPVISAKALQAVWPSIL